MFIKLRCDYYVDPKIIDVGPNAELLYVRSICFAKQYLSDGVIRKNQLPLIAFGLEDVTNLISMLTRQPDDGTRPLWQEHPNGWIISAYLDHNDSKIAVEALQERMKKAATISVERRSAPKETYCYNKQSEHPVEHDVKPTVELNVEHNGEHRAQGGTRGDSVSVSVSGSTAVDSSTVLNKSTSVPVSDPGYSAQDNDSGIWEPDDPDYVFDPKYTGKEDIEYWSKNISKIQSNQIGNCLIALNTMHRGCKRSPTEIRNLIKFVAENADAKNWWGIGKTMATWTRRKDGITPLWQTIRANWLRNGGSYSKPLVKIDPGPKPEIDYNCGCKRGWIEDDKGQVLTCPKCDRGKWYKAGGRD